MPRIISSFATYEKNKQASPYPWLVALQIAIPGVSTPVRLINNTESVTWRGESWIAFPFDFNSIEEESTGEAPRVDLRVSNVSRAIEAYLQDFDVYVKTNGYSPITVTVYVILDQSGTSSGVLTNTSQLGAVTEVGVGGALTDPLYAIVNPDPEAEFLFELISQRTDSQWAYFTLGATNPYTCRYPRHRIMRNHCRFVFKDTLCGYSGAGTTCDKTLTRCRALSNSVRFGGFPGVGMGGLRLAG